MILSCSGVNYFRKNVLMRKITQLIFLCSLLSAVAVSGQEIPIPGHFVIIDSLYW